MTKIVLTETGIIAIATIVASLISVIVNSLITILSKKIDSKTQLRQRQFELYYLEKSKVFEDFVAKASLLPTNKKYIDTYDAYYASALKAYLLCNPQSQKLIKNLLTFTNTALLNGMKVDKDWEVSYLEQLSHITSSLNDELKAISYLVDPKNKRYTRLIHKG